MWCACAVSNAAWAQPGASTEPGHAYCIAGADPSSQCGRNHGWMDWGWGHWCSLMAVSSLQPPPRARLSPRLPPPTLFLPPSLPLLRTAPVPSELSWHSSSTIATSASAAGLTLLPALAQWQQRLCKSALWLFHNSVGLTAFCISPMGTLDCTLSL